MRFSTLLKNPADWMQGHGLHSEVVMTSRIRLARNLRGWSFPGWSAERQRVDLMNEVRPIVSGLPEMKDAFNEEYTGLAKVKKQVLVERHLISREHAARSTGCAVIIDRKQTLAIMVNEEDHLRMQGICAALKFGATPQFRVGRTAGGVSSGDLGCHSSDRRRTRFLGDFAELQPNFCVV
jgi:protein arginine kinase